jgi:ubiquinone/menaquinone biosynthesis C-methylase UbiE
MNMSSPSQSDVVPSVPYDHSATYRDRRLRNLPHRLRLRSLISLLERVDFTGKSYIDVGCSNGYITSLVTRRFQPARSCGLDHNLQNLERARMLHPGISFRLANISQPFEDEVPSADIVTCFETLEHVGNLEVALNNLLRITRIDGTLVLSVPIEIGARGMLKFAAKLAWGYRLAELPQAPQLFQHYVHSLATGKRISVFRDARPGWGTHFGFDYRDLDDLLSIRRLPLAAWNDFTTRFYRITHKMT